MIVYLLNILQSNELQDVMNQKIIDLCEKHEAKLYQSTPEDAIKYIAQFLFIDRDNRDKFADEIPYIAFEYEDLDYPNDEWEEAKNGVKLESKKPEKHKANYGELKIESVLDKNKISYNKFYFDTIDYDIHIGGDITATIMLDYKFKFVVGGVARGEMIICKEKKYVKEALNHLLQNIVNAYEKYNKENIIQ